MTLAFTDGGLLPLLKVRLAVLASEQTDQQAKMNLVQAQANRLGDTVALFQALGGGWWNDEGNSAGNRTRTAAAR